jgi:ABC-type transporter Mla subunit MlaD
MSEIMRGWFLKPVLDYLKTLTRIIAMNQAELEAALAAAADKTEKIIAEVQASTQELKDALAAAGSTTPEVNAALARLQGALQVADDLNPDPAP